WQSDVSNHRFPHCRYTVPFLRSLGVCTRLNPSEPMVLFLEGCLQMDLATLGKEEKIAIEREMPLPEYNFNQDVAKLSQSISRNRQFCDASVILASLLAGGHKIAEAKEVIQRGLAVERLTKSDHMVAEMLQKLNTKLNLM